MERGQLIVADKMKKGREILVWYLLSCASFPTLAMLLRLVRLEHAVATEAWKRATGGTGSRALERDALLCSSGRRL